MNGVISGNMVGGGSAPLKTVILEDENGNEVVGIVTESPVILTARPSDIKIGKTAAIDSGVVEGENTINYRTEVSNRLILPGEDFSIPLYDYNQYDYTKFQCIIVVFDSDYNTNVELLGVSINDSIFSAETSEKVSDITKNHNTKSIDLNLTNTTDKIYSIRYFTYHEELEE